MTPSRVEQPGCARLAHNQEVVGSNPTPATYLKMMVTPVDNGYAEGVDRRFGFRDCDRLGPRFRPEVHFAMLSNLPAIPSIEDLGAGWVCRGCGSPVGEPSALLGRAWCAGCERYDTPTQAAA
jgi:hypothetical protein